MRRSSTRTCRWVSTAAEASTSNSSRIATRPGSSRPEPQTISNITGTSHTQASRISGRPARKAAAEGAATLGQTIRAARESRGLTQVDLAARARVAQAYLSYLEQDQREPSLSIAARIARELEIPLDELASIVTR